MRRARSHLLLLLFAPRDSSADAILVTQSYESRTSYGTSIAVHDGLPFFGDFGIDVDGIPQPPLDWVNVDTRFETVSGPLLQQTLETNAAGEVTGSLYLYEGGTFVMEFDLYNSVTGETRNGLFVAPIIGPIRVTATEDSDLPSHPSYDSVEMLYLLGPGLFDDSIASALGIRRRTAGGNVFDPYLTFGTGDPTTPERTAWEGAPTVTIRVPEPAALILFGTACLGPVVRRRRAQRHS